MKKNGMQSADGQTITFFSRGVCGKSGVVQDFHLMSFGVEIFAWAVLLAENNDVIAFEVVSFWKELSPTHWLCRHLPSFGLALVSAAAGRAGSSVESETRDRYQSDHARTARAHVLARIAWEPSIFFFWIVERRRFFRPVGARPAVLLEEARQLRNSCRVLLLSLALSLGCHAAPTGIPDTAWNFCLARLYLRQKPFLRCEFIDLVECLVPKGEGQARPARKAKLGLACRDWTDCLQRAINQGRIPQGSERTAVEGW